MKGKYNNFVQLTTLYFFIIKFQIDIFPGKTVQCDAVQYALHKSKTLLLVTSLYKPYCLEVHLLNQHYLHIWSAR